MKGEFLVIHKDVFEIFRIYTQVVFQQIHVVCPMIRPVTFSKICIMNFFTTWQQISQQTIGIVWEFYAQRP